MPLQNRRRPLRRKQSKRRDTSAGSRRNGHPVAFHAVADHSRDTGAGPLPEVPRHAFRRLKTCARRSDYTEASSAIARVGRSDRSAQGFVQPNGHHYLRTGVYLNGYRVAAMLRLNTWECELTPEAVRLRRNGVNIMTVYITFCRGRLKPQPRTRFTFSSVALGTNRPRFVHWLNRRMNSVRKMSATRVSPWNTSMFSSFVVNSYRT